MDLGGGGAAGITLFLRRTNSVLAKEIERNKSLEFKLLGDLICIFSDTGFFRLSKRESMTMLLLLNSK